MEIALAGNPNVGKSIIFSRFTGVGVVSSNYPGTTVEFFEGKVKFMNSTITVIDLPGIYSLAGNTDDERVATNLLFERRPDTVIAVLDTTRLERNLVLLFELIESGYNTSVALNMYDVIRKNHLEVDLKKLERILSVPVVPTVATKGEGIDDLLHRSVQLRPKSKFKVRYDSHIEEMIKDLSSLMNQDDWPMPLRAVSIRLLSADPRVVERASSEVRTAAEKMRTEFERTHKEDVIVHIQRDRFGEAGRIVDEVVGKAPQIRKERSFISDLTLNPATGIPILIAILAAVFLTLVFVGGAIEGFLVGAYTDALREPVDDLKAGLSSQLAQGVVEGVYVSIEAMLAIVIPYILVFYLMLAVLEDTGYLVRVVSLLDGVMHRLGLHGRAIIPMVVGYGCNVPAILATRAMGSKRERLILAVLITMAVPCSAQTAIIIGTVGNYAGIAWALLIYVILGAMLVVLGFALHRIVKFEPTGLFLEIPELRAPLPKQILGKTYIRTKEFMTIAFPLLLVGSIALESMMVAGILDKLVAPSEGFMMVVLGLPGVTVIALVFGILRKEMALQMLMVLFGTSNLALHLSPDQMFVFALVMAIFMPCLAALAVMVKEFGAKNAAFVTVGSIVLAIIAGAAANAILSF